MQNEQYNNFIRKTTFKNNSGTMLNSLKTVDGKNCFVEKESKQAIFIHEKRSFKTSEVSVKIRNGN